MEGSFSVSTNNRFAFFMDEEDDPGDITVEESKGDKSKSKDTAPAVAPPVEGNTAKEGSPKNKKRIVKDKGQPDSNKRTDAPPKKREPNSSATDKGPPRDKTGGGGGGGDKPPRGFRDNRRNGNGPNERNDRGGSENNPPRPQGFRNRGRLPSKDGPEGGPEESSYNNGGDSRSRPRWNRDRQGDRGERMGGGLGGGPGGGDRGGEGGERRFNPFRNRGGGAFRGGKREFERRSGSDKSSVKPIDKREGGGAHNWGTVKDEMNDWPNDEVETPNVQGEDTALSPDTNNDTEDPTAVSSENKEEGGEEGKEQKPEGEEGGEEEKEEEQLTLDEYKALQEKKRSVPLFKERRPGENEDQTRWKNTFVYERTEGELIPGTREIVEKLKTSGREKTVVESNFFFRDPQRFGGRGGGRGGGGGGGAGPKRGFGDRRDDDRRGDGRRGDDERRGDGRRGDDERRGDGRRGDDERRGDGRRGDDERRGDGRRGDDERRGDGRRGDDERRGDGRRGDDRRGSDRRGEDRRRGGGGGGGDDRRGGGRPPRNRDRSNFNVEDEKDFPSLGTVSA